MAKNNNGGCTYGKVTRTIVENIKEDVNRGFTDIAKRLDKVDASQIELFNHRSNYYSPSQVVELKKQKTVNTWLVGIICSLIGLAGSFAVILIK